MKIILSILIFQFNILILHAQEFGSDSCQIYFETEDADWKQRDSIKGFELGIKRRDSTIFEWDKFIGTAYIFPADSIVSIKCESNLMYAAMDSFVYYRYVFATITVNVKTCSVNKIIPTDSLYSENNPEILCTAYHQILKKYKRHRKISPYCRNVDYVRVYAFQLMYAAIHGSTQSRHFFCKMKKDFDIYRDALDGEDYLMNTKIIEQLLSIHRPCAAY